MELDVRVIDPEEFDTFRRVDERGFQHEPRKADDQRPETWARGELDRAFGAFSGGEMVGIGRNYSFDVTVPGGARLPAGAVSWVSVLPTHRRRGVLTAIMAALASDSTARGEPLSILTASESLIYRRFGYGVATDRVGASIESRHSAFLSQWSDRGRVRFVERDEAAKVFPEVYERTRTRPGTVARPDFWWSEVLFDFPDAEAAHFFVVHETEGVADGFAGYIVKGDWNGGVSGRTIEVVDLQADGDAARLALWRYLADVDLVVRVTAYNVPLDDPIRFALVDPRRYRIDFLNDGLYVKVLDIPAALSARTYEHDGALRFSVPGTGAFDLAVTGGEATCTPVRGKPAVEVELELDVLGSLLLGARRASQYLATGRVRGDAGAIATADALFATTALPAMLSYF
jgi:predicted acetyltransferase